MCGIVGYIGNKNAVPVLIGGLEKLEYRGYDSAGVATIENNNFEVFRTEGKLQNLKNVLVKAEKFSLTENKNVSVGIGHTRWATHGRPSETNAHPHVAGEICVVHNGIIENYVSLREQLQKKGRKFASETDTEIAAHLIEEELKGASSLFDAVKNALAKITGSYALVVIRKSEPDKIIVAKNSTPVIIGLAENGTFIASDIPAILEHTRRVLILEDGDLAEITNKSARIEHKGKAITREPITVTWDPITAEKGGFRHFMLKEIYEQPQVVTETFRGRIDQENHRVVLDDINLDESFINNIERICIVACGTAWHASLIAKFHIERLARINVDVDYGSEFRYRDPIINNKTLFIAVSQSGETADTLSSLTLAAEKGARTLAICNVLGSTISRRAENVVYTYAGPEISVASTKAFVTQVTVAYLLALKLGLAKKTISEEQAAEAINDLIHLPALLTRSLSFDCKVEEIAKRHFKARDFLYLGRGILYPIALEGALKLKEISYIHAEGYPAGEMKHGPIALINEETPVVVILGEDGVNREKTMSNLKEVESRGGKIIAVTDEADSELRKITNDLIEVGKTPSPLLPIVLSIPLQLLAYHTAVLRGTDVDQPRNLAKSVTVE